MNVQMIEYDDRYARKTFHHTRVSNVLLFAHHLTLTISFIDKHHNYVINTKDHTMPNMV